MSKDNFSPDENISLILPIIVGYTTLEDHLKTKFIGEVLKKESSSGKSSNYAKILDISLSKSDVSNYELNINLKIQTLTLLYRNKEINISILASLLFDSENQRISIDEYKIDSQGKHWLADQLLESVVNNFLYNKLRSNMQVDLAPILEEQLENLNQKLEKGMEAAEGLKMVGSLQNLSIYDLQARETALWIFIAIKGWGVVEVEKLASNS
ncbi:MAG: DUF4403 family protein [Flavobacteriaceae bacterium]|nr:DUF4403 family protein [Flavobacteriaceae bacterium]